MGKLNNLELSLLSLCSPIGILLMPVFWKTPLIFIPILMCITGGFALGTLIAKSL